jgi:phosphate-selective porin OprO/OprP
MLMALSLGVVSQPAWAQEKKDDKAVLDEVLDILKEKGQITQQKYQELKERAKREGAGKLLAGFEGVRPYIKSLDGQHKIELTGRLNFDVRAYEDDTRNLDGSDQKTNFLVRRARIGVDAAFFKYLNLVVEGEFAGSSAVLQWGYIDLKYFTEARLRAGQFKVPFSFEELTSSRFIDFVERSVVNNLVPTFDVGAMLHGSLLDGGVEYGAGVFNGAGQNAAETNDSKDIAGRLLVRPFKLLNLPDLGELHLAGHFTHGDQDSGQSLRGRTDGKFEFFPRTTTRGDRLRYGFEAVYSYGPFGLYGEYVRSEEERKGLGTGGKDLDDLIGQGWYVAGSAFLTGEVKVHGKAPKVKPMNPRTGDLGAVEVAARFAQLDFDASDALLPTTHPGPNRVDAFTAGINWYLSPNVRLMFNWTQNWFDNLAATPNTKSPDVSKRSDDTSWEILSRLALWF